MRPKIVYLLLFVVASVVCLANADTVTMASPDVPFERPLTTLTEDTDTDWTYHPNIALRTTGVRSVRVAVTGVSRYGDRLSAGVMLCRQPALPVETPSASIFNPPSYGRDRFLNKEHYIYSFNRIRI